ncbi:MAG: hypothetical protein ACYCX5_12660 [Coriobacteriia bacterium]
MVTNTNAVLTLTAFFIGCVLLGLGPVIMRRGLVLGRLHIARTMTLLSGLAASAALAFSAYLVGGRLFGAVLVALVASAITALWAFVFFSPTAYRVSLDLVTNRKGISRRDTVGDLGYGALSSAEDGTMSVWHAPPHAEPHVDAMRTLHGRRFLQRAYVRAREGALERELRAAASGVPAVRSCGPEAREYAQRVLQIMPAGLSDAVRLAGLLDGDCVTFVPRETSDARVEEYERPWVLRPANDAATPGPLVEVTAEHALDCLADHLLGADCRAGSILVIAESRVAARGEIPRAIGVPVDDAVNLRVAILENMTPFPLLGIVTDGGSESGMSPDKQPSVQDWSSMISAARCLVIGAYDGESFLVFDARRPR